MERLNTLLDRVEELKADKQEKDASSRLVTLARKAEVEADKQPAQDAHHMKLKVVMIAQTSDSTLSKMTCDGNSCALSWRLATGK